MPFENQLCSHETGIGDTKLYHDRVFGRALIGEKSVWQHVSCRQCGFLGPWHEICIDIFPKKINDKGTQMKKWYNLFLILSPLVLTVKTILKNTGDKTSLLPVADVQSLNMLCETPEAIRCLADSFKFIKHR